MIYCTNQPLDNYDTITSLGLIGLNKTYGDRPALFAAVLLMTEVGFQWEHGSPIPEMDRFCALTPEIEGYLVDTLYYNLGGRLLTTIIGALTPWEMLQYLQGFPIYDMPLCKYYPPKQVLRVVKARVGAWLETKPNYLDTAVPDHTRSELRKEADFFRGVVYEKWV